MKTFELFISNLDPITAIILVVGIIVILVLIPMVVRKSGISKLGPIQIEQENQTQNHLTNQRVEQIDIENRENLWEMTEELVAEVFLYENVSCYAVTSTLIHTTLSPIRTMILLNHIAPKLTKNNEKKLREKIDRSIAKGFRDIKLAKLPESCPSKLETDNLDTHKYKSLIDRWLELAREITSKACADKIKAYELTLEIVKDPHWQKIFQHCREKNISYIEDMGYNLNKDGTTTKKGDV